MTMAGRKKDDRYECLADSLAEESLAEAADTLFGERRRIEQGLQDYEHKVRRLLEFQKSVESRLATLHYLLRRSDPETVSGFYRSLNIDPAQVPSPDQSISADLGQLQMPFGLRARGRYAKLLLHAYRVLEDEVRAYMYGRYYQDPEDVRCMRVTLNYRQLKELCDQLSERIDKANQSDSFTQALQFSKRLDVEQTGKESLAGGPMQYTLDREMAFTAPDFAGNGLKAYPDLPSPEEAKPGIRAYAKRVFRQAPQEVRSIVREVKRAG
jgi:hypothetical protein